CSERPRDREQGVPEGLGTSGLADSSRVAAQDPGGGRAHMSNEQAKQQYAEAQRLYQQQKFPEALAVLDALDAAFPNQANIVYARARCLVALNRLDEARPLCTYLGTVLGDKRGAELLAQIDSVPAAPLM